MDEGRPNPDALLASLQKQDAQAKRGKLKVFFGMAPGVGKTYAMLEAARREQAAGRAVALAYVETHGRKETDALAEAATCAGGRAGPHQRARFPPSEAVSGRARTPGRGH
jgi:two-component system sensor histidine kinase KdpD